MDQRKPYVELIAWTPNPLELMWKVWHFAKDPLGQSSPVAHRHDVVELFRRLVGEFTAIPEFVSFAFLGRNISRSLLAQLTRHRLFSFFGRSQRVDDLSHFADQGDYFTPDSCAAPPRSKGAEQTAEQIYRCHMSEAQWAYTKLLQLGVPIEDARGVLPEHSLNDIAFACNLRALAQAVSTRTCWMLQGSYWEPLLGSMAAELTTKVDSELAYIFAPPCKRGGNCLSGMEQERRLKGEDPYDPCPIYLAKGGQACQTE